MKSSSSSPSPAKKRIPETRKFLLKWESQEPNRLQNMTEDEKKQLPDKLSFSQIGDLKPKAFHDENARRKRKWREIRQLWTVLSLKQYSFQTIENAFWKQTYGTFNIPCELFVSNMISHFRFDDSLAIDKHLRWLYWSFEGGSEDRADWRDIFSCLKVLLFARCVGGSGSHCGRGVVVVPVAVTVVVVHWERKWYNGSANARMVVAWQ